MRYVAALALSVLLSAMVTLTASAADEAHWYTDYTAAVAEAKKQHRPLLLDFTGSDWCGWCKKLKKEVFNTPDFAAWAAHKVVLVEVDFPQSVPQTPEVKQQNESLAKRFNIEGFPTIILLDETGTKQLGTLGYMKGGPAAWTAEADKSLGAAK